MAKLTTKQRNALPASDFAGPNRTYPVNDAAHAKNAKSRVAANGSPALQAKVDAKANKVLGSKSKSTSKTTMSPADAALAARRKSLDKMAGK